MSLVPFRSRDALDPLAGVIDTRPTRYELEPPEIGDCFVATPRPASQGFRPLSVTFEPPTASAILILGLLRLVGALAVNPLFGIASLFEAVTAFLGGAVPDPVNRIKIGGLGFVLTASLVLTIASFAPARVAVLVLVAGYLALLAAGTAARSVRVGERYR